MGSCQAKRLCSYLQTTQQRRGLSPLHSRYPNQNQTQGLQFQVQGSSSSSQTQVQLPFPRQQQALGSLQGNTLRLRLRLHLHLPLQRAAAGQSPQGQKRHCLLLLPLLLPLSPPPRASQARTRGPRRQRPGRAGRAQQQQERPLLPSLCQVSTLRRQPGGRGSSRRERMQSWPAACRSRSGWQHSAQPLQPTAEQQQQ